MPALVGELIVLIHRAWSCSPHATLLAVMSAVTLPLLGSGHVAAAVVDYTSKSAWEAAAGPYTTIDFTGYAPGTIITNQYASLGVIFTEGNDRINALQSFVNDGFGLNGVIDTFTLEFSQPMRTIACEFPGTLQFRLFWQGEQFYTNAIWFGGVGTGFFGGLVSNRPFDRVVVLDPEGAVFVDDLHFGQGVPGPGAVGLLGAVVLVYPKRRRR